MGSFTAEIYDQLVPITGNNFIGLAESGFYNNLIFHRVVAGFVIQDGCPYGTGYGGPGWTIPLEIHPSLHHDQAGILGMARSSDPNSAGSQYYITLSPQPGLDGDYAVFGKVVQGLDAVLAIGAVPVDANSHPLTPVTIDTLRILDLSIGNLTPPDTTDFFCPVNETQMFIVEAESENSEIWYSWYVDGILQNGALDFIFETSFPEAGEHSVVCNVSCTEWSHDVVWSVVAQGSDVEDPVPPPPAVLEINPNPARCGTWVKFNSTSPANWNVTVHDLRGRVIRRDEAPLKNGVYWFWDCRDDRGQAVPAGIYIIRARYRTNVVDKRCVIF